MTVQMTLSVEERSATGNVQSPSVEQRVRSVVLLLPNVDVAVS